MEIHKGFIKLCLKCAIFLLSTIYESILFTVCKYFVFYFYFATTCIKYTNFKFKGILGKHRKF